MKSRIWYFIIHMNMTVLGYGPSVHIDFALLFMLLLVIKNWEQRKVLLVYLQSPNKFWRVSVAGIPHLSRDPVVPGLQHNPVLYVHIQCVFGNNLQSLYLVYKLSLKMVLFKHIYV